MKRKKTPAECIGGIISAAMAARGVGARDLAKLSGVNYHTIYSDLADPDRMPMRRVWLYFTALGVPVDDGLQCFADSFARSLVER